MGPLKREQMRALSRTRIGAGGKGSINEGGFRRDQPQARRWSMRGPLARAAMGWVHPEIGVH